MFLSHSNFPKVLISVLSSVGLVTVGNFIFINAAHGFGVTFENGGFENTTDGLPDSWSTIGDVTTNTGIDGVNPISGSNQAIITNAYNIEGDRTDDSGFTFNQSGTNPVDADTITDNHTGDDLQSFLGLATNDLSIDRNPVVTGFPRTSKEGSGMYQDIEITISTDDVNNGTNSFQISFNWAYLTNDGQETTYGLGNQDFSFISLINDPNPSASVDSTDPNFVTGNVTLLGDSDQTITAPTDNNDYVYSTTTYYDVNNVYTQSVTGLAAGTYSYRVGFGVVDIDNVDHSSALLLDNFNVQQVPFKFSPGLGLLIAGGMIGCDLLRRRLQKDTGCNTSRLRHPSSKCTENPAKAVTLWR